MIGWESVISFAEPWLAMNVWSSQNAIVKYTQEIKVLLITKCKLKFLKKFTQSSNVLYQMFIDFAHTESGTYSACGDRV